MEDMRTIERSINRFFLDYAKERGYFVDEAMEAVEFWDEDDEAAMVVGNVSAHKTQRRIAIVFRCASTLDAKQPPVTHWIQQCLDAARAALPAEHAAIDGVTWICDRKLGAGLKGF